MTNNEQLEYQQEALIPPAYVAALDQLKHFANVAKQAGETDILDALGSVTLLEKQIRTVQREIMTEATRQGHSWRAIGDTLGVSRQTAHARYQYLSGKK